jgi:hypothetical protein
VSSVAAMMGKAAFFDPLTSTEPDNDDLWMTNLSIFKLS